MTLVARRNAIDVERRPGPQTFERGETFLAIEERDRQFLVHVLVVERQLRPHRFLFGLQLLDVVVEVRDVHAAIRIVQRAE